MNFIVKSVVGCWWLERDGADEGETFVKRASGQNGLKEVYVMLRGGRKASWLYMCSVVGGG